MRRVVFKLALVLFVIMSNSYSASAEEIKSQWITIGPEDTASEGSVVYHRTFDIGFKVDSAQLKYSCMTTLDYRAVEYRIIINGISGPGGSYVKDACYVDCTDILKREDNRLDIQVDWKEHGMAGPVILRLDITGHDEEGERTLAIVTDGDWSYSLGKYRPKSAAESLEMKEVVVQGPVTDPNGFFTPKVGAKKDLSSLVGVTDVAIKGGNSGTLFQFAKLRDYSDKFYFLKPLGYYTVVNYIFSQMNYLEPGQWFWGYDKELARSFERNGFDFSVYPWTWIPSKWFMDARKPVMAKSVEKGDETFCTSLFDPMLLDFTDEMYGELAKTFGDEIKVFHPAVYGDFGECHYPAGWNTWLVPKYEIAYPGFWVGDDLARVAFVEEMIAKYGSLDAVNNAWSKDYENEDEITYPPLDGTGDLRHRLDFVDFYYDVMTRHSLEICILAKKHFPHLAISPLLGCADENPMWGQDNSAIPEALATIGVGVHSTHGTSPNYMVRRLSSAAKFYGNAFETETASGTDRRHAALKFFIDASCGCDEVFEYPHAIVDVADIFSRGRRHLHGEHSITDIAYFFPTSWHRSRLREPLPERLFVACEESRDVFDFDIVDENMVIDSALAEYKSLIIIDGDFAEDVVLKRIIDWVEEGGTLYVTGDLLPIKNVEGEEIIAKKKETGEIVVHSPVGKGEIVVWQGDWSERVDFYKSVYESAKGEEWIDGESDGVWTTVFTDRAIFYNHNEEDVEVTGSLSAAEAVKMGLDFTASRLDFTLTVPARQVACHTFKYPLEEHVLECESARGADKYTKKQIADEHSIAPATMVTLTENTWVESAFTIENEAEYFFSVAGEFPTGSICTISVDGSEWEEVKRPSGPHEYMFPFSSSRPLTPGTHTVSVKCTRGKVHVDKVILTSDDRLAGFSYDFTYPDADQSW